MNELINFDYIQNFFAKQQLSSSCEGIVNACHKKLEKHHGDVERWQKALKALPRIENPSFSVDQDYINLNGECSTDRAELIQKLKAFCPWRKGPFNILDIPIDTEWDSLKKWRRVQGALSAANISLEKKHVLDIGCGNGAFLWGILEDGAQSATGVDPMWLFYHQFMVMQKYLKSTSLCFLPLGVQDLPLKNNFDVVLSMGVLYHRKSPLDHLAQLKGLLRKDGVLIMETIVLPESGNVLLTPPDRYAGMRNVWMIPSVAVLQDWIIKMGFSILHTSSITKTTTEEQKQSEWMDYYSLNQFLDEKDDNLTIEGHSAPYRVIIIAQA